LKFKSFITFASQLIHALVTNWRLWPRYFELSKVPIFKERTVIHSATVMPPDRLCGKQQLLVLFVTSSKIPG
jgi:hypothetical protein